MSKARGLADLGSVTTRLDEVGNTDGALSNRNLFINSGMQVWQRGTSSSTNGYLADRWEASNVTTASRQTDAPDEFQHSIEVGNSSASYPLIIQRIEAANVQHLSGQAITLSFWAKSISGTATLFTEYLTPSITDNFSSVTIRGNYTWATPSTSWVKYTYTIASVNAEVLKGLEVRVGLQNQSAGTVRITGVQLEIGDTATPFEHRSYGQELALCQRFFQKVYVNKLVGVVYTPNGDTRHNSIQYSPMRSTPTVSPATHANHSINFSDNGTGTNTPTITYNVTATGTPPESGQLNFGYSSGTLSGYGGSGAVAAFGINVFTVFSLESEL
jgi:hypothetical protein